MTRTTRSRDRGIIFLLGTVSAMGGVATNVFLPALPEIRSYFGVSIAAAQTTISAYIIAFAGGILLAGPLSDRFGRRPLILAGLSVFATGGLLAALAPSLTWLVVARIVQAIGAAAGMTVARATIGDISEHGEVASRMALMTMAIVLSNALAPYIGGLIAETFGWHGDFWLLFAIGCLIAVACWKALPETRKEGHTDSSLGALGQASLALLRLPVFRGYLLQASAIYAIFLVFMTVMPYVLADDFGAPPTHFGLYSLILATGYFLGNMYVSRHGRRAASERLPVIGLSLQLAAALVTLLLALVGPHHPLAVFGPLLPLTFGQGLALPFITARSVTLSPNYAGIASSLLGFSQQAGAAVAVQAMGWAPTTSAVPVLIFCSCTAAVALLPLLATTRGALAQVGTRSRR